MSTYCRNRPEGKCPNMLRRALDSILSQTLDDIELVLIDDRSKDGSEKVCREYAAKDKRVSYYRAKRNSGRPAVRYNDGMRLARSEFFMFMFDDDELYPDGARFLYDSITGQNSWCGMVYGLSNYVDGATGAQLLVGGEWDYERMRTNNRFSPFCNLSVMVRKDVIDAVGGYDESAVMKRACDWDLWVRIGEKFPVAGIYRLVGKAYQGSYDSIGKTVPLTEEGYEDMFKEQRRPDRRVRLKGEMGMPVGPVREEYE